MYSMNGLESKRWKTFINDCSQCTHMDIFAPVGKMLKIVDKKFGNFENVVDF